jgi:predicted N-acetyltransferase YhbS
VREIDNYPMHLPDGDFERFLRRPEPIASWVAEAHGVIVGHVAMNDRTSPPVMQLVQTLDPELPPVYVARLLVDPRARRRGAGQLL